jgi:monoamine oxidase
MRTHFARWFLVLLVFSLETAAWPAKPKPPVCIVGAGPAGLIAANKLESKGYQTVIFEKQPEIGGKCQAYYEKKKWVFRGSFYFYFTSSHGSLS